MIGKLSAYHSFMIFRQHTIQSEQRWELPAVVNPGWIRRTRHPQVFVDGGGGDDVPVDGGRPPVTVRQGDPDHHPPDEPQHQSHYFHNRIHDASSAQQQSAKSKSRSQILLKSVKRLQKIIKIRTPDLGVVEECRGVSGLPLWDVSCSTDMYNDLYDLLSLPPPPLTPTIFFFFFCILHPWNWTGVYRLTLRVQWSSVSLNDAALCVY